MRHQSVDSSRITSVGHDPDTNTLSVKFKNGKTYKYPGVPASVHQSMMDSPSVGKFLNSHIEGRYPHDH